jgi:beta-lactamase class D
MLQLSLLCLLGAAGTPDPGPAAAALAAVFAEAGVDGTIVVASADSAERYVHDDERASARLSPASTFKVPNTLIALAAGTVTSANHVFEWDGVDRGVAAWNRDQTLASAFEVSCVWCYQRVARRIGRDRYEAALADLGYGDRRIGARVDEFWLDGSLRISAREQVEFLTRLVNGDLPYSADQIDILRTIMRVEAEDGYTLYAKSGWTGAALHTGWYVGFVETSGETWLFALNIDMAAAEQAPLRKQLALGALRALGIL